MSKAFQSMTEKKHGHLWRRSTSASTQSVHTFGCGRFLSL